MTLTDLPPELIDRLLTLADPSIHYDLARTCKYLYSCSRDVLKSHQTFAPRGTVFSDILPGTIPEILRDALSDRIAAYYVRDIEIWACRSNWESWVPLQLVKPSVGGPRAFVTREPTDETYGPSYFTSADLGLFGSYVDKGLSSDFGGAEWWTDHISNGHDSYLKVLLIAHCPWLDSVRFIKNTSNGANRG